jgi:opacity protein-like surface antigen
MAVAVTVQAQIEFTAGINGALGFHDDIGFRDVNTDGEDYQEVICGSLSSGVGLNMGARTSISDHVQLGMNLEYYRGCRTMTNESIYESGGTTISNMQYAQYNRLAAVPHVRLLYNPDSDVSCYSQGGVVLPLMRRINYTTENIGPSGTSSSNAFGTDKFSVGFQYGAGFQFNRDKFSIGVGVVGTQLVGKKHSFEYTSILDSQGEEQIGNYNTYQIKTNYVPRLDGMSNNFQFNPDASNDQPRDALMEKQSNHNIGVGLDIMLNF